MKFKLLLAAAFVAVLGLTACGGGSDSGSTPAAKGEDVATLTSTDTTVGTGPAAVAGNNLSVQYTLWLYSAAAAGNKGKQIESNVGGAPFTFKLGAGQVIPGWDQGLVGVKAGGKRTLIIPSSLAYGPNGQNAIPGGSALVFDIVVATIN
jgi:FKBP-type peptidyl-prolyl cis-trans isomerase FkpA